MDTRLEPGGQGILFLDIGRRIVLEKDRRILGQKADPGL